MQRKVRSFTPKSEDVFIRQQVHALPQVALLIHSHALSQMMGFLIISIVEKNTKALTARSVLTVSAMLVTADEGEIFGPSHLSPGKATEIKQHL